MDEFGDVGSEKVVAGEFSSSLWLAPNPSKRWGELFFLLYTPFWLTLCLGIVVPYKLYEVTLFNFMIFVFSYLCSSIESAGMKLDQ